MGIKKILLLVLLVVAVVLVWFMDIALMNKLVATAACLIGGFGLLTVKEEKEEDKGQ